MQFLSLFDASKHQKYQILDKIKFFTKVTPKGDPKLFHPSVYISEYLGCIALSLSIIENELFECLKILS